MAGAVGQSAESPDRSQDRQKLRRLAAKPTRALWAAGLARLVATTAPRSKSARSARFAIALGLRLRRMDRDPLAQGAPAHDDIARSDLRWRRQAGPRQRDF